MEWSGAEWTVDSGQWTVDSGQWTVDNHCGNCSAFAFERLSANVLLSESAVVRPTAHIRMYWIRACDPRGPRLAVRTPTQSGPRGS